MNEQEKSLALARLMGWEVIMDSEGAVYRTSDRTAWCKERLNPYDSMTVGRSQFAAILLKFPEVMSIIVDYEESMWAYTYNQSDLYLGNRHKVRPTQANILDEILKMAGIEI